MYVTENINPLELLSQILSRAVPEEFDTQFEGLTHNNHLCPKFKELVDKLLWTY